MAVRKFRLAHTREHYALIHNPEKVAAHTILCPLSLSVLGCLFVLDFDPRGIVILDKNAAVSAAFRIVDACVGNVNFDGGKIFLASGHVEIKILHTFTRQNVGVGPANESRVLPLVNSKNKGFIDTA